MSAEQQELINRLGKAKQVLAHIDNMIEDPGGSSWPARFDLTREPVTDDEGIEYVNRAVRVDQILTPLATTTRPKVESRVKVLNSSLLITPVEIIRASVERRRQGQPGLPEVVLERAKIILARQLGQLVQTEQQDTASLSIPVQQTEQTKMQPAVPEVASPIVPAVEEPGDVLGGGETPDAVRNFDSSGLELSPTEENILRIVQDHPRIDRLMLARSIWPNTADEVVLNRLTYQLSHLRQKTRTVGFSIADVGSSEDSRALYDIVTVQREAELAQIQSQARGFRGAASRSKKEPKAPSSALGERHPATTLPLTAQNGAEEKK